MTSNIYSVFENKNKEHYRARSQTVGAPKSKKKQFTKHERHAILLKTVKDLGYDMSVFHLRWMPGEYLDEETLKTIPIFWFKKFGWAKQDVTKLYLQGQITLTNKTKRELEHVFGKRKKKKKLKKKNSIPPQKDLLKTQSVEPQVNTTDIYRRTRRLLKKVSAVPSKVLLSNNKSAMNITNAGFPDLAYVTTPNTVKNNDNDLDNIIAALHDEHNGNIDVDTDDDDIDNKNDDNDNDNQPATNPKPRIHLSSDLIAVSENKEMDNQKSPFDKIDAMNNGKLPLSPFHQSQNSISTPFGDMDANSMINLRAKHRRTSSLMHRVDHDGLNGDDHNSAFSMINHADAIWNKLAIKSGRGDTLTQRQFDIELQNNDILADPDIGKELFKLIQNDNPVNKKQINKGDIDRVCAELDKIPLLDEIAANNTDQMDTKIAIILKQIFVHIIRSEPFNVNQYLTVKLTTSDLNNCDKLLEFLSNRQKEWNTRLQILEWITANLENSVQLEPLCSDENIGPFLLGWMTQCLDERSNLAKSALEMFPNIYSITMTKTGESFQYLDDIFSSLFLVIRNKRSKDLNQTADECLINSIDMIMDWHEHGSLDNEVLLEISHILRDNTSIKEQKHDKVRERCVAYFGFILYGISGDADALAGHASPTSNVSTASVNSLAPSNHVLSKSADYVPSSTSLTSDVSNTSNTSVDDIKNDNNNNNWVAKPRASFVGQKDKLKISSIMKRKYLLNNNHLFMEYMSDALKNGTNDKSAETRNVSFKLLEKLEKDSKNDNLNIFQILNIDPLSLSKYKKWKQRKLNKKNKKKSGKKKSKRKKYSNKSRFKHLKDKNSVTLTISGSGSGLDGK